uniref:Xoo1 protein n=1 Tax=Xenopus laevis TaxID=8355 RepID=Q91915_XENLA|nr:Xoo1 protein [Xenopus laevis]
MTLQMASSAKSLFGGPTKSKSCFSNVGFTQEHNPRKEESPLWNLKRRLSSEEQHERRLQADMETRDSLYAQRKAERAMMREQMRSKYHLPKSAQDQPADEGCRESRTVAQGTTQHGTARGESPTQILIVGVPAPSQSCTPEEKCSSQNGFPGARNKLPAHVTCLTVTLGVK